MTISLSSEKIFGGSFGVELTLVLDKPYSKSIDEFSYLHNFHNLISLDLRQNKINIDMHTEEQIYKLTKDDKCIDEFYKLLKILGLSRRRYKKYIDTNYEWRKQSGFWTIKEGE